MSQQQSAEGSPAFPDIIPLPLKCKATKPPPGQGQHALL